jgi:butyrate kinase
VVLCPKEKNMAINVLAINPGGTSTKIGYFSDNRPVFKVNIEHAEEELKKYAKVNDQLEMRCQKTLAELERRKTGLGGVSATVGRGGVLPPLKAGAYRVNAAMMDFLLHRVKLEHAANLGGVLADKIARLCAPETPAFIYDGETLDQLGWIARYSGTREIWRESLGHILNGRAVARIVARQFGKEYEEMNLVVAHMGGGVSLNAHEMGRVIEVMADDEGPMSVERAGSLALKHVIRLCYENPKEKVLSMLRQGGGLKSYLGTNNGRAIEERIRKGDADAQKAYQALAYQVAKGIGDMAVALRGKVDAIALTGGLAHSKMITGWIEGWAGFIAPVRVVPGEYELEALAQGAWRVLTGVEGVHEFILP